MACSSCGLTDAAHPIWTELKALRAAPVRERAARQKAEARASGAVAMIVHLRLLIDKLRQDRFGASAERGAKLVQLEAAAREDRAAHMTGSRSAEAAAPFTRRVVRCLSICRASAL